MAFDKTKQILYRSDRHFRFFLIFSCEDFVWNTIIFCRKKNSYCLVLTLCSLNHVNMILQHWFQAFVTHISSYVTQKTFQGRVVAKKKSAYSPFSSGRYHVACSLFIQTGTLKYKSSQDMKYCQSLLIVGLSFTFLIRVFVRYSETVK